MNGYEKIMQLRRKRAQKVEEAKSVLDDAQKRGKKWTDSDEREFEKRTQEIDKINDEILNLEEEYGMPSERTIKEDPGAMPGEENIARKPTNDRSYRGMFPQTKITSGGFKDADEFFRMVAGNIRDIKLEERATMIEGDDGLGGYAVPEEYASKWLDSSLEEEIVRPRATVWPMKSDTLHIPRWSDSDRSASNFGGLEPVWIGENETNTRQNAKLALLKLIAKKLAIFAQCSREVAQDGVNFESQLNKAMIESMNYGFDYAFIQGDGVGKPLGFLNDPAKIAVARTGAADIVFDDVLNLWARIYPGGAERAIWLANPKCKPALMKLYVATGTTSGSHVPVITSNNGRYELLFRPIIFTDKVPTLGTEGDLMLVDVSQYQIGLRQEVILDRSNAPGWTEDAIDFRCIIRADGQGGWPAAITPRNGDTLSWIVVLSDPAE